MMIRSTYLAKHNIRNNCISSGFLVLSSSNFYWILIITSQSQYKYKKSIHVGRKHDKCKLTEMSSRSSIYHEKQVKELCALHALNNLFQISGTYSKSELDLICSQLSPNVWINPHKSMLGMGNYDINVIMAALQRRGFEAIWFDKRKDPGCLNLGNICGFILNVPSDYKLGFVMLPLRRRHWIAIRQVAGSFYNLDSKLEAPHNIGRSSDLVAFLKEQLDSKERELFVVVTKEVETHQLWLHPNHKPSNHQTAPPPNRNDSPSDSLSSNSGYDYRNRDAECVTIGEVKNNDVDDL